MNTTKYFIDTSALFKRYINETGTNEIDILFKKDARYLVSNLAIVEFISNLKRLVDIDNIIDFGTYMLIKKELFNDIGDGKIEVVNISSDEIIAATELIDKKYITPIDSIQLAFAVKMKEMDENSVFVCSDKKLCSLAANHGIKVLEIN